MLSFKLQKAILQRLLFFGEVNDELLLPQARCGRSTRSVKLVSGMSVERLGEQ